MSLILLACDNALATQTIPTPIDKTINFKHTTVSLTFDDGNADNYAVRSILAENRIRATFYIVSGFTGSDGFMTAEQLRGLYEDGNEVGGHTLDHRKLTDVRGADLKREVCQDRLNLLAQGFEVNSFAYPFGNYDLESKQTVIDCGYNNARIVTDGPESIPPADPYALQAMPYVVKNTSFPKLFGYVKGVETEGGGWVILVFHHICNGCNEYSIPLDTFENFADWLGHQQKERGLMIKTVNEVIGGEAKPGVGP